MAEFYEKANGICKKYLSDGGKTFLDKQITAHLNKSPDALLPTDKAELAKWCRINGALILGKDKAEKLANEILSAT